MNDVYMAVTWCEGSGDFRVRTYLINPTDRSYRLSDVRDAGIGWGQSVSRSLKPHSYIRIDELNDMGQLDFTTSYDFVLTDKNDKSSVRVASSHINGWNVCFDDDLYQLQPILNLVAKPFELAWEKK